MDKLLILDLDETLIHSTATKLNLQEDFKFQKYYVYKRPHLTWFLTEVSKHFRIGVWSAADEQYVEKIVEQILPKNIVLEIMWGQSWCSFKEDIKGNYVHYEKRLLKLTKLNFKMESIILIDDNEENARINKENTILIKPFKGKETDNELKYLFDYLITIKDVENIAAIEKSYNTEKQTAHNSGLKRMSTFFRSVFNHKPLF